MNKEVKEYLYMYFIYSIYFLKIVNGINKNKKIAINTD